MNKIAFVMDPFEQLNPVWDSTLMMIQAALKRQIQVYFFEPKALYLEANQPHAHATSVLFCEPSQTINWYKLGKTSSMALTEFEVIIIRKDPPFDIDYVFLTYLLDRAVHSGVRVTNSPAALRNFNEKMVIFRFPECIAPTLVSADKQDLRRFWNEQGEIILKPLDGLGGRGVFHVKQDDTNFTTMVEMLTQHGQRHIMAQRYLPEARIGDKRIIILHGEVIPLTLARIPSEGEARANIVSGATFKTPALTDRDKWICNQLIGFLKEHDIAFAGIDVIGNYLTEINLTSPGGMMELSEATGQNLAERFLDRLL